MALVPWGVAAALWLAAPPLRLDLERARARRDAEYAWQRETIVGAWERSGEKDPRSDAAVREALELAARRFSPGPYATRGERWKLEDALRKATEAGCKDPLVLYLWANNYESLGSSQTLAIIQQYKDAAQGMERSGYPAIRKAWAFARAAKAQGQIVWPKPKRKGRGAGADWLDKAISVFGEAAGDPRVPPANLGALAETIEEAGLAADGDRAPSWERLRAALERARPDSPLLHALEGRFWTAYAWDARGSGYAPEVADEGARLHRERLGRARASLERALEKDPRFALACRHMITVCLGEGAGPEEILRWLDRTLGADPDDLDACEIALEAIEPKWGGTPDGMLDLGRRLAATGNWDGRLPLVLVRAHRTLAERYGEPPQAWYGDPAKWREMEAVWHEYLRRYPEDFSERSRYARAAFLGGRFAIADEQFKILGDRPDWSFFDDSSAKYNAMRNTARRNREAPAAPAPAP